MTGLAVLNRKGGVGKTTTTMALAELSARTGKPATVVDLDPLAGAATWAALAEAAGDPMAATVVQPPEQVTPVRLPRWARDEIPNGLVVFDCPPGGAAEQEAAAEVVADRGGLVIVPTTPAPADMAATLTMLDALDQTGGLAVVVLLTMTRSRTIRQREARAELTGDGAKVLVAEVPDREEIRQQGIGVVEAAGLLLNAYYPVWLEIEGWLS